MGCSCQRWPGIPSLCQANPTFSHIVRHYRKLCTPSFSSSPSVAEIACHRLAIVVLLLFQVDSSFSTHIRTAQTGNHFGGAFGEKMTDDQQPGLESCMHGGWLPQACGASLHASGPLFHVLLKVGASDGQILSYQNLTVSRNAPSHL